MLEDLQNRFSNPELPNSIYKARVSGTEVHPETDSINIIYTVDGESHARKVTFNKDIFNQETRGINYEDLFSLQEGLRIQLQNSSHSNVPDKIWIVQQ